MVGTQKNVGGFGKVGVVLTVVVMLLVIGGIIVYNHNNGKKPVTLSINESKTDKKTGPSQQYLTIKEWKVRIAMPSDVNMSDIYYVLYPSSSTNPNPTAALASYKLSALTPYCIPQAETDESPFGYNERSTPTAYKASLAEPKDPNLSSGILFDSYYYQWQTPRSYCYNNASGNSGLTQSLNLLTSNGTTPVDNFPSDMSTLLKNIETIPTT